jgi:hypothetical protein
MSLKPGLAKHLKELEQKVCNMSTQWHGPPIRTPFPPPLSTIEPTTSLACVQVFDMGSALRSYQPRDGGSAGHAQKQQSDVDLPEAVQRQLKDLKFEAVTLKKAGDREGAKDRLRQMNDLRVRTRRASAADAATSKSQDSAGSGDIDWESAAGAIDFDSLYKQRTEEKQVVDEFGVDLATVRCVLLPIFQRRAFSLICDC